MNKNDIEKLIGEFKIISLKQWIKSVSNSFGSVGLTFKNELKKKPDSLFFRTTMA